MITITPLKYKIDLISHYDALSHLPGFVILESKDKVNGRFDIVSALPYDSFTLMRDSPERKGAFAKLDSLLEQVESNCDLPFQGGIIGYIAYDLATEFSKPPHPSNDTPLIALGFYDWAIVTDHLKQTVQLIAANRQPETMDVVKEVMKYWRNANSSPTLFKLLHEFSPLINKNQYQESFKAIYAAIKKGRAYQVNYTQPFLAEYSGDAWEIYKRVRLKNPVPYAAFLRGEQSDILSFSPEQFITMEKGCIKTSPIKGTAKRSFDKKKDQALKAELLKSEKNRAENIMIVDLMRNDFATFSIPGTIKVKSLCEVQSYSAVHHLVSTIEGQYKSTLTPLQALAHCFPGGSVTGAPKREAMRIINEQEPYARGVYCGSICYLSNHGRFDSNIAIRTMTATENMLYLSAGGGIVIDSLCEEEYRECFTKISAIMNAL